MIPSLKWDYVSCIGLNCTKRKWKGNTSSNWDDDGTFSMDDPILNLFMYNVPIHFNMLWAFMKCRIMCDMNSRFIATIGCWWQIWQLHPYGLLFFMQHFTKLIMKNSKLVGGSRVVWIRSNINKLNRFRVLAEIRILQIPLPLC